MPPQKKRGLKQLVLLALAALLALSTSSLVAPERAPALPQEAFFCPDDFSAMGDFVASGVVVFNTDTLTFGGGGGGGVVVNGYAVFTFDSITVPAGSSIVGTGSRPLVLLSNAAVLIGGDVVASGSGGAPGPGGSGSGSGPGKGLSGTPPAGSGGGGFGGIGGGGGGVSPGAGGPAYGNLATNLVGGSGGGASGALGGGGGGALFIGAATAVTVSAGGAISANGGNGASSAQGGSGGGSGGAIALYATTVTNDGIVRANGGFGGDGSPSTGAGGGGGGGRIIVGLTAGGVSNGSGPYSVQGGLGGLGPASGNPGAGGVVSSTSYSCGTPTAVTLWSLHAKRVAGGVLLRWRMAGESGFLGFDVYRGERRLNRKLIAASGGPAARTYTLRDVRGTVASRYWLELVRADGSRSRVGPVRAAR